MICFVCNHSYSESSAVHLFNDLVSCPECGAAFVDGLEPEDERYILLVSLCVRAEEHGERKDRFQFVVQGTPRELAILELGDKCDVDDRKGRISDIDPDTGMIQVFLNAVRTNQDGEVSIYAIDER